MPLNMRSPGADASAPAHTYPISRSLAMLVLIGLVLLFALRHVFGQVSVSGGVK
jgi:hypothetical protein